MKPSDAQQLTAIIVDDEELARQGLALRLEDIDGIEVQRQCKSGKEALAAIAELEPDVVFLDIQMPGMTGFDVIRELQTDAMPLIIFVTAFDQFAIDAFKVQAVDYLLKPVEPERLQDAVGLARHRKDLAGAAQEKQKLLELAVRLTGKSPDAIGELLDNDEETLQKADRLAIKDGSSIIFVPVKDIDWVDAAGDYMCVHARGETHIMRTTMKQLESRLDPAVFQRVHRSTIVNLQRVEKVSSHINGEFYLTLSCGSSLKMSRSYRDKVKHFF